MTEIRIEKKRSLWPWVIISLILAALVVYFMLSRSGGNEEMQENDVALITVRENNPVVSEYIGFVTDDSTRMSLDHSFTHAAIVKLANGINAMASEIGYDLKANMDSVNSHAVFITQDAMVTTHADHIRKAAEILSNSLQRMQQAKYPELSSETESVKNAAMAIDPAELTLDQRDAVKQFFRSAADLLEKMN